jgi:type IV secretory pathway component VirB8
MLEDIEMKPIKEIVLSTLNKT